MSDKQLEPVDPSIVKALAESEVVRNMPRQEQRDVLVHLTAALAEAIHDAGEIPSGYLYAAVMSQFNLENYNVMLLVIKKAGLISIDEHHMIRWTGK